MAPMNSQGPISLVVFDLGRVLIRICDGWRHACEVAGVTVPLVDDRSPDVRVKLHEIVCASEVGDLDLHGFAAAVAPYLGIAAEAVAAVSKVYLRGPYPGASELLDDLRAAGVATACLSNTNSTHWQQMTDPTSVNFMGFEKLTHAFASHLLRMRKPEERIYAHVERVSGAAPPSIVFFDDIEENVVAAAARGWRAHQIRIDADPIAQARQHLAACGLIGGNGRESV